MLAIKSFIEDSKCKNTLDICKELKCSTKDIIFAIIDAYRRHKKEFNRKNKK